jgi:hypothetical protein
MIFKIPFDSICKANCVWTLKKTQVMIIHRNTLSLLSPVRIDDTIFPHSNKVKYLSVIIYCNLTWNDQISYLISGAITRLWCTAYFRPIETCRKLVVAQKPNLNDIRSVAKIHKDSPSSGICMINCGKVSLSERYLIFFTNF